VAFGYHATPAPEFMARNHAVDGNVVGERLGGFLMYMIYEQ
jgi:hypothetical protein